VSKRANLAMMCRDQRNQAFEKGKAGVSEWEHCRVLNKCAVLLGVIALILDEDDGLPNTTLYRREGRKFIKVEK
jgi:hypothetical protein